MAAAVGEDDYEDATSQDGDEEGAGSGDDDLMDDDLDAAAAAAGADDDDVAFAPTDEELPAVSYFGTSKHEFKEKDARLRQRRAVLMTERDELCATLRRWLESNHYTCVPVEIDQEQQYLRLIHTFSRKALGSAVYARAVQQLQMDLIAQAYKDIVTRREKEYRKACVVARKAAGVPGRKKKTKPTNNAQSAKASGDGAEVVVVEPLPPVEPTLAEVLSEAFVQSVKEAVKTPRVVVMLSDTKERGTDEEDDNGGGVNEEEEDEEAAGEEKRRRKRRPKPFVPLAGSATASSSSSAAASGNDDAHHDGEAQQQQGTESIPAAAEASVAPVRYVIPGDILMRIERLARVDEELAQVRREAAESKKTLDANLRPFQSVVTEYVNRVNPKTRSVTMRVELPEGNAVPYLIRLKTYRRQPQLNVRDLPVVLTDTLTVLRTTPTTATMLDEPFSAARASQFLQNVELLNLFGTLVTDKSYTLRESKAHEETRLSLDRKIIRRGKKRARPADDDGDAGGARSIPQPPPSSSSVDDDAAAANDDHMEL